MYCVQEMPPIKLPQAPSRRAIGKLLSVGGKASRPTDIAACPVNWCLYVGIANDQQDDVIVAIQLRMKSFGVSDKRRL